MIRVVALVAAAAALAAYGLFALLYEDEGAPTSVEIVGREHDADLVGSVSLAAAGLLLGVGIALSRRRRANG